MLLVFTLRTPGGLVDSTREITTAMIASRTPVVVFILISTGLVPYKKMRQNWRVAYLVISTVAAFSTPDWSWFSMTALAVCMVVLYEGAMALSWVLLRKKIKAQQLAEIGA